MLFYHDLDVFFSRTQAYILIFLSKMYVNQELVWIRMYFCISEKRTSEKYPVEGLCKLLELMICSLQNCNEETICICICICWNGLIIVQYSTNRSFFENTTRRLKFFIKISVFFSMQIFLCKDTIHVEQPFQCFISWITMPLHCRFTRSQTGGLHGAVKHSL